MFTNQIRPFDSMNYIFPAFIVCGGHKRYISYENWVFAIESMLKLGRTDRWGFWPPKSIPAWWLRRKKSGNSYPKIRMAKWQDKQSNKFGKLRCYMTPELLVFDRVIDIPNETNYSQTLITCIPSLHLAYAANVCQDNSSSNLIYWSLIFLNHSLLLRSLIGSKVCTMNAGHLSVS